MLVYAITGRVSQNVSAAHMRFQAWGLWDGAVEETFLQWLRQRTRVFSARIPFQGLLKESSWYIQATLGNHGSGAINRSKP